MNVLSGDPQSSLGIVVIGRNEGERLRRCLVSICAEGRAAVVYVDSGSTDGSVAWVRSQGIDVIELDMASPFTAARARNAGWRRLIEICQGLRWVQFVDGDCELAPGWLDAGQAFLGDRVDVACVCGLLRERFPERSVYNRLCDAEWQRPSGLTEACGGIAMMRVDALVAVGGFRDDMLAGEEPELCTRLRARGGLVWRIAEPMASHDANIVRFGQWWRRSKRAGFGYALRYRVAVDLRDRARLCRQMGRAWAWACVLPLATLAGAAAWGAPALLALFAYPVQLLRLAGAAQGPWRNRVEQALFGLLGKAPELIGQVEYWHSRYSSAAQTALRYRKS